MAEVEGPAAAEVDGAAATTQQHTRSDESQCEEVTKQISGNGANSNGSPSAARMLMHRGSN